MRWSRIEFYRSFEFFYCVYSVRKGELQRNKLYPFQEIALGSAHSVQPAKHVVITIAPIPIIELSIFLGGLSEVVRSPITFSPPKVLASLNAVFAII